MRKGFSIKSKLVLILLLISLLSIGVIGYLGLRSHRAAVTEMIFNEMVALRRTKAEEVDAYFHTMRNQVEVLSEDTMVSDAMIDFGKAFRSLDSQPISSEMNSGLENYYTSQFFPKLFANLPGQAEYSLYRPANPAALYLQYHYIAATPYGNEAEKMLLDRAKDGSEYSAVHADYHPRLRNIVQKLGFYDLMLVNIDSGDVVYTVAKETDFGSNIITGPNRKSNAARAFELARANPERGAVQLVDFELYRPGYGIPSAFWSVPLYNGSHLIGVMLVQISLKEVNKIMTYNQNWSRTGLGKTGESYLIGQDFLLRSDSRFLVEDPTSYLAQLRDSGVPERTIGMIEKLNTSTLFQKLNSFAAQESTLGHEGTILATDYRGVPAISSYQPVTLETLQWGLVTKIDQNEAFAPIYAFENALLISTVLMMVLCAFGSMLIANRFLHPINLIVQAARQVRNGQIEAEIPVQSKDELGELANSFNSLVQDIRQQTELVKQKNVEIERLWRNLLPGVLAQQAQKGETKLLEQAQQVSVLATALAGFREMANSKNDQEIAQILHELTLDLEEVASRQDMEHFVAIGQQWLGVCGLTRPHLDHSRRAIECALAAQQIMHRLNQKHGIQLQLVAGIHAGAVTAAAVGSRQIATELWGETVNTAMHLRTESAPDRILVSQAVYDSLQEQYHFRRHDKVLRDVKSPIIWVVEGMKE